MTNGKLATLASGAFKTIRKIIKEERLNGCQNWMRPAYQHANEVLDMTYAQANAKRCDQLSNHIYLLRRMIMDLRNYSTTFGYGE